MFTTAALYRGLLPVLLGASVSLVLLTAGGLFTSPGLQDRWQVAARLLLWSLLAIALSARLLSGLRSRGASASQRVLAIGLAALAVVGTLAFVVAQAASSRERTWAQLEAFSAELKRQTGSPQLQLPDSWVEVQLLDESQSGRRLAIKPIGRVHWLFFGVDPLYLDYVEVTLGANGEVENVRANYF